MPPRRVARRRPRAHLNEPEVLALLLPDGSAPSHFVEPERHARLLAEVARLRLDPLRLLLPVDLRPEISSAFRRLAAEAAGLQVASV